MDSNSIADLRARFEWAKRQATEAHRAYNAAADVENKARAALKDALVDAYGPTQGKIIMTTDQRELKLTGVVVLDRGGNLACSAHYRLKSGGWSIRPRVNVVIVPAPKKEVPA